MRLTPIRSACACATAAVLLLSSMTPAQADTDLITSLSGSVVVSSTACRDVTITAVATAAAANASYTEIGVTQPDGTPTWPIDDDIDPGSNTLTMDEWCPGIDVPGTWQLGPTQWRDNAWTAYTDDTRGVLSIRYASQVKITKATRAKAKKKSKKAKVTAVTLTGTVKSYRVAADSLQPKWAAASGRQVYLQRKSGKKWVNAARAHTTRTGRWTLKSKTRKRAVWRVVVTSTDTDADATSHSRRA